jgi:cytosine/adenosine deaminase-related metal-dependent hydrolase
MLVHRAAWVLPIARPPIRDGWVAVDTGAIVDAGAGQAPIASSTAPPNVVILPGFVNAHTHLELSWMRGLVGRADSMPEWVGQLLALRLSAGADPPGPIRDAIVEMRATGTTLVGDITNTYAARDALAESQLSAVVFRELIGFNTDGAQLVREAQAQITTLKPFASIRDTIVPHAPYSVSRGLFEAIAETVQDGPISVHLGESPEELEFLRSGTGAWRALLEGLHAWRADWIPPACDPVEFVRRAGMLHERLLAVHCVQLTADELLRLADAGATIVTCPRSNVWTGVGSPPVQKFFDSGARVAIGTDSLASNEDLNLFHELAAVRRLAPQVPASRLLRGATLDGANALGFGSELGSIEPGKRAELIAVRVPEGVADVEEYLVAGHVGAEDVRWLESE